MDYETRVSDRSFRRLWLGQAISQVGDYVFTTTVALWIGLALLRDKPYAPAVTAAALVITATVTVVAAPVAGVFVDRWHKVRVALGADVVRASVGGGFALLPLLAGVLPLWATLALCGAGVAVQALASVFFNPARVIIVSDVVPADRRAQAASFAQASSAVATIVGPVLGSLMFVAVGPAACFAFNGFTFVASFLMIRISAPWEPRITAPASKPERRFRRELWEGVRLVVHNPTLRAVLGAGAIVMLGASMVGSLNVYFVHENLRADPWWFGVISSALGAGIMVGAMGTGFFGDRLGHRRILIGGLVVGGVACMAYARTTDPATAALVILGYGLAGGAVETALSPILLNAVSRDHLARVLSLLAPAFRLSSIVSLVLAGWLVSLMPIGHRFAVAGVGFGRIDAVFGAAGVLFLLAAVFAAGSLRDVPKA